MLNTFKKILKKIPYLLQMQSYKAQEKKLFTNFETYRQALKYKGSDTVNLYTNDGLNITIRQNIWDAKIIRENFIEKPYIRHFQLDLHPTIVDIGGYIGDFSLYAAKYLNAKQVIVYEPTAENFKLLKQNIENNNFQEEVIAVNKAVGDSDEIILNTKIQESDEVHVSAYWYQEAEHRRIPCVTLAEIFEIHSLKSVDLLKIDCEGGEYDIFLSIPDRLFNLIKNIVFEYHHVDGFEVKLAQVLNRLKSVGYVLKQEGQIISAYRV